MTTAHNSGLHHYTSWSDLIMILPALHLLQPGGRLLGVLCNSGGRPQPLSHGGGPGPQPGQQVDRVDELAPQAGLPAHHQPLLLVRPRKVHRVHAVVLDPVGPIRYVVEVPGGGQQSAVALLRYLGEIMLTM